MNQAITTVTDFDNLVNQIAPIDGTGMVAATSARVYRVTYTKWQAFAAENGIDPLAVNYDTVRRFLADQDSSRATKQRQLSALRKIAEVLAILDYENPARKAARDSLTLLKVRGNQDRKNEREKRALTPAEADRMLRVWQTGDNALAVRNMALVAVLLLSGLRRAELVALQWQDIDFENGVVHVAAGKGEKTRQAAIFGAKVLDEIRAWQLQQPSGYRYVFVPLRKGGKFTGDKPMTTTDVYRVVKQTAELAGLGHVKPHDLRRTLATELLATGSPVHEVQQQLGHENAQTTLDNYAVAVDARQRRKSAKIRYG